MIIKQHISADGYECRLVKTPTRYKRWEVNYEGRWLSLSELSPKLPGRQSVPALTRRVIDGKRVVAATDRAIQSISIPLWGGHGTPSTWATQWARSKHITPTPKLRGAFIREVARRMDAGMGPSTALEMTLRSFEWQPKQAMTT